MKITLLAEDEDYSQYKLCDRVVGFIRSKISDPYNKTYVVTVEVLEVICEDFTSEEDDT